MMGVSGTGARDTAHGQKPTLRGGEPRSREIAQEIETRRDSFERWVGELLGFGSTKPRPPLRGES